jgi:hypothetical protein
MESISLYSEARNEYLKQMASWLSSPIVEFFRTEYQKIATMNGFQAWCADVPKWNQDVIETNVSKILDSCRCDYVEELMTAVFIAHTKNVDRYSCFHQTEKDEDYFAQTGSLFTSCLH